MGILIEENNPSIQLFASTKDEIMQLAIGNIPIDQWIKEVGGTLSGDSTSVDLANFNATIYNALNLVYKELPVAELHLNYLSSLNKSERTQQTSALLEELTEQNRKLPMDKIAAIIDGKMNDSDIALQIAEMKLAFLKSILARLLRLSERIDQHAKIMFSERKYSGS